ncbi:MAG: TetR/AcrR family transcriptional regulator [Actinomycetota bacterium]|nr:TetR/AcrR family transcriptional regulator [Actinomycetota bacterium]
MLRSYDNSGRREQAAATKDRIVSAGADLLRESSVRDWRSVTVRSVAERAGTSERTIYRHFGSEKGLRDAIMERHERQAGIDLTTVGIDDLADVAARVLAFVSEYPPTPEPPLDPTLHETDARRRAALLRAVAESAPGRTPDEHLRAAATIDLIWSISAYERLLGGWQLDSDAAIEAVRWGIGLVVADMTTPPAPRDDQGGAQR